MKVPFMELRNTGGGTDLRRKMIQFWTCSSSCLWNVKLRNYIIMSRDQRKF